MPNVDLPVELLLQLGLDARTVLVDIACGLATTATITMMRTTMGMTMYRIRMSSN